VGTGGVVWLTAQHAPCVASESRAVTQSGNDTFCWRRSDGSKLAWPTRRAKTVKRRPLLLVVAILAAAALAGAAEPVKLPDPPEGYRWLRYEEGKSAYLRPEGWYVKTEVEGKTASLFISKENIDKRGSFETGLTVHIIGEVEQRAGVTASKYATAYVEELAKAKSVVERAGTPTQDGYTSVSVRYRDATRPPTILVHTHVLADDTADVLRIAIFEAPESEWDSAWTHGERLVRGHVWR